MSLVRIPGQPISFYPQDECVSTGSDFFQLVLQGDELQFQFEIDSDCQGVDVVFDGNFGEACGEFWTLGDGWTCYAESVCYSDGDGSQLEQSLSLILGTFIYYLRVEVSQVNRGGFEVKIDGIVYGTITVIGEYDYYIPITNDGATPVILSFNPLTQEGSYCISLVSMVPISSSNYYVNIFTSDGAYVAGFNFLDNPDKFNFYKNFLTVTKVADFPDGCYYFCVNELCNCISDTQTIDICDYTWETGPASGDGEWNVSESCYLVFGPGAAGDTQTIYATGILCEDFSYIITIGCYVTDARFKVIIGSFESAWFDSSGYHVINNGYLPFDSNVFQIVGESTGTGGGIEISEIIVNFNGLGDVPSGGEFCSQPIQVYSDESQFCTQLLKGCNNSDAFGFGFNDNVYGSSGFQPQSRVQAKLFPGKYNQKFSIEESSLGQRSVKYAQSRKAKRLRIIDTAEYLWDWIALWIGLDTMQIGGLDYVIEEDGLGDVTYNKFQTLGTGDIQVGIKTQDMYKTNDSDAEYCKA